MKKDLKDIKRALINARNKQSAKRAKDVDSAQVINQDVIDDKYEALYSKGMSHDATTLIADSSKIKELQIALESGKQSDFDDLDKAGARKQASPQGALSVELSGADPEGVTMDVCPAMSSREAAAEMIEVYEKNILRNISFSVISGESTGTVDEETALTRAITALNNFGADFKGPKVGGLVTRKSLFRGVAEGELVGPYISQFMLLNVGIGNHTVVQQGPTKTGVYGITEANYLEIQKGNVPVSQTVDSTPKYISSPAQLGSFVHIDLVYQAFLYASAILLNKGAASQSAFPTLAKEGSFLTNGGPVGITAGIGEISRHALKAAWVQKWRKHLRARPEVMAARIVKEENGVISAGTVHSDIFTIGAATLAAVKAQNVANGGDNEAFLPLQIAEGSPTHPSYPAGHAAIAGACATLLKLYFADAAWSSLGETVVESLDGSSLDTYAGGDEAGMTIHGEINKLASNMSIGRNMVGVHYRSDGDKGLELGEKVAIQYFKDLRDMQNEDIGQITIVKFDGTTETV